MFWQKLISNQKLNFQEKKWILSGLTFFNDNNGKPFIPHVVFRTLHFFRVYWKTLQTLGSTWRGRASRRYIFGIVCFVLSGALLLFHVRNLAANSIRMIFWYIILMRHVCPFDLLHTWTWLPYPCCFRFLCPSLTSPPPPHTSRLQKKRDSWNDRFRSKPGGLQLSERTCQDFKRTKSSVSIAGLVFYFFFSVALQAYNFGI